MPEAQLFVIPASEPGSAFSSFLEKEPVTRMNRVTSVASHSRFSRSLARRPGLALSRHKLAFASQSLACARALGYPARSLTAMYTAPAMLPARSISTPAFIIRSRTMVRARRRRLFSRKNSIDEVSIGNHPKWTTRHPD